MQNAYATTHCHLVSHIESIFDKNASILIQPHTDPDTHRLQNGNRIEWNGKKLNERKRWSGWRGSVKTAELEMLIRMNVVAVFETDWTIFEILFSRVFDSISNVLNIRYRYCCCCNTELLNYRLLAICVTFYPFTLVSIPAINNNQLVFATKQHTHTHTQYIVHFRHWLFR